MFRLCILDLNIPLKVVSVDKEILMYLKTSLYIVIHLLVLSSQKDISLKDNLIAIPTTLFNQYFVDHAVSNMSDQRLTLKVGLEYAKLIFAPRKIAVVQHAF